jgi:hypothetical protein
MIVWQGAASDQNLALSFQEESGRDSIFEFIEEVQKHLDNQIAMTPMPVPREEIQIVPATPIPASPIFGMCAAPSLGNIK